MTQETLVTVLDKLSEGINEAMELACEWKLMAQYLEENKDRMVEMAALNFIQDAILSPVVEDEKVVLENLNHLLDYLLEIARLSASFNPVGDIPPRENLRKNSKMSYSDIIHCLYLLKDTVRLDCTSGEYNAKVLLTDCFDTLIEAFSEGGDCE